MSKNINSKLPLKMKPQSQSLSKSSNIASPNNLNQITKEPQTSAKTSILYKGKERINRVSAETKVNLSSSKRTPSRDTVMKLDKKTEASRLKESTVLKTLANKPRSVLGKQVTPLKNKQLYDKSKSSGSVRPSSSKLNLAMSSVHNVTVSSPPSKRKESPKAVIDMGEQRIRSKSRTLSPEEIVILKGQTINKEFHKTAAEIPILKIKEPVAFEVIFDNSQKPVSDDKFIKCKNPCPLDQCEYSDDFESYESDFETGSSSDVESKSSVSSKPTSIEDRVSSSMDIETDAEDKSELDDESYLTHVPITVIHHDKELERKLDSGNYDLNLKKARVVDSLDSFDTLVNTEELDSGISYSNISDMSIEKGSIVYGGFSQFYIQPKVTKRGTEIMSKIQFDKISFTILDLKPFPYNIYMKFFGSSHTVQSFTQTSENHMESECQTDEGEVQSIWTQHPPQYNHVLIQDSTEISHCTGEAVNYVENGGVVNEYIFDQTIQNLSKLRKNRLCSGGFDGHQKPINFECLNNFLSSSSSIVSRIISKNAQDLRLAKTDLPYQSKGFFQLNTNLLNALKVIRVFANIKFSLILTVHESIENVYHKDFSNLIMVWDCEDAEKPLRLLSTWSEVSRAEICNDSSEIIVCGLRDGSVAMWDLRETYSFCSKLDGHLTHFSATHSIAPSWGGVDLRSFDVGAVIDVKSFRSTRKAFVCEEKFKTIQFASLNEAGFLTIWTLVEITSRNLEISKDSDKKFEYSSPWARVKLIQSAICDLREYIELKSICKQSTFERTKSNFQKDVYNDDILKELAESQNNAIPFAQGLRFINIECGKELIFVGTNRNYIISCSKTLKKERFRRINIIHSGFLFPTALKLLENEKYLAVGLSNGSVMILNCNHEKTFGNNGRKKFHNPNSTRKKQSRSYELDDEVGKSCAIQNIIKNERLSSVTNFVDDAYESTMAETTSTTPEEIKMPCELKIFDEQVLLSGSVLRKDLVQKLEFSSDSLLLFALSDGNVLVYDFCIEAEIKFYANNAINKNVKEIAVSRGHANEKYIILLDYNNNVQVHLLK
ncbi:uncharacterized protein LOC129907561 [Episyrphus balteatus]|uniref:uncharacterized protein LOC129907561 n=1 Tax=Episyrphus balteatus TaxID=286459 RepID=UPI0024857873|nr:uncharacterized protein LOC129907561 [Episyrphus balteatus]